MVVLRISAVVAESLEVVQTELSCVDWLIGLYVKMMKMTVDYVDDGSIIYFWFSIFIHV